MEKPIITAFFDLNLEIKNNRKGKTGKAIKIPSAILKIINKEKFSV